VNVFYVLVGTTKNYRSDEIGTAALIGNVTNYENSQCNESYMFNQR